MKLTAQQLADACHIKLAAANTWLPPLLTAMARFKIDTPCRMAAFLPQIAHESGRFAFIKEIWGPTEAQARYEGRHDLGNTQPGDGKRYKGRGLIQITGRANYRAMGEALQIDAEAHPELLEQPLYAALSAGWFWQKKGLNELADQDRFTLITQRINGGQNGAEDRRALWTSAKAALGIA